MTYVELQVTSHFSFLRGASSPEELFAAAALQGHAALGIADLGTVAGIVRAWDGQRTTGVRLIAGTRLLLDDGRGLLLYPMDRPAWSRMTRLLTIGKARFGKGGCTLSWGEVVAHSEGMVAVLLPDLPGDTVARDLAQLHAAFGDRGYMALTFRRRPDDVARLHVLANQAEAAGVRAVATGDVLYHAPECRLLQDVVTAIRERTTIDALGHRRERHGDRNLKAPSEMERRFAPFPDAIAATADIARRCTFDLSELSYQYPHEQVIDGLTAQQALERLSADAVERLFPDGVPQAYRDQIAHELRLIERTRLRPLLPHRECHRLVRRRRVASCARGAGRPPTPAVCFVLGITSINPIEARASVRALRLPGAARAARHRRRLRARAPGGGHPVDLRDLWAPSCGADRRRLPLSRAWRRARGRQGPRAARGRDRRRWPASSGAGAMTASADKEAQGAQPQSRRSAAADDA
jgi:error-prone DNA polymerase